MMAAPGIAIEGRAVAQQALAMPPYRNHRCNFGPAPVIIGAISYRIDSECRAVQVPSSSLSLRLAGR